MTGLALVIRDYSHELEYDLMTMTGRTLSEYMSMGADGRIALAAFIRLAPPESALYRASHPSDELPSWGGLYKTNAILADIYDAYAATHTKKGRKAKPYPRPGVDKGRTIGKGAVKIRDFEAWWNGDR